MKTIDLIERESCVLNTQKKTCASASTNGSATVLLAQLREIPELNVDQAVECMDGHFDLYLELAQNIVAFTAGTEEKILMAIGCNDMDFMHDVVHGLKGMYGRLGADNIFRTCLKIEMELERGTLAGDSVEMLLYKWRSLHDALTLLLPDLYCNKQTQ